MVRQQTSDIEIICHARPTAECQLSLPVLDCGATASVVGSRWLGRVTDLVHLRNRKSERRKFKFGDNKEYVSTYSMEIGLVAEVRQTKSNVVMIFWINASVLSGLTIPLLISRQSLKKVQGRLDFITDQLTIHLGIISLGSTAHGHLLWPIVGPSDRRREDFQDPAVTVGTFSTVLDAVDSCDISKEDLIRLHMHLSHGSLSVMTRILKAANKSFDASMLETVITNCNCMEQGHKLRPPLIQPYFPPYVGRSIGLGIFFPVETEEKLSRIKQTNMFLLITCMLCRLVMTFRLSRIRPEDIGGIPIEKWIRYYGRPIRIICDRGPGFIGSYWKLFGGTWSRSLIYAPKQAAFSNGLVERPVDLLKLGFAKARPMSPDLSVEEVMCKVSWARNLTPLLNCGLPPLMCMTGRSDVLAPLGIAEKGAQSKEMADHQWRINVNLAKTLHLSWLFVMC